MPKTFDYISDPGHGWIKVPMSLLLDLGIEQDISAYSYMRGSDAYLEEDDDASLFMQAYTHKLGARPSLRDRCCRNRNSRVRGYRSYEPPIDSRIPLTSC